MSVLKSLVFTTLLALCLPAYAMNCTFNTYIEGDDLYNSYGTRLSTVGQIIRQDRANVYEAGGSGDYDDCGLDNIKRRETLQRVIDRSKISKTTKNRIRRGNVDITVDIINNRANIYIN